MHCVTLADLAATLAQHGPCLLETRPRLNSETLLRYWTASRTRNELWHRAMGQFRDAKNAGDFPKLHQWWTDQLPLLEEVFVSELLARVVAAIGSEASTACVDSESGYENLAAVTHGIFLNQLDASNRVSKIILDGTGARTHDTVRLNRLRYGVDRWSDWLVARISLRADRSYSYAIDVARTQTFCEEVRESSTGELRDMTTWLMNAAMREMLVRRTSERAALAKANHDVATAVLGLFRPELFDDFGVPKSLWLHRLQHDTAKTQPIDFAAAAS